VLGLLGGLLLYMLPRKRGVDAGEVQDLHNKAPRTAATVPVQDKDKHQEEVAEMAGRAPEIDEDLHSRQLAVYGRETMKRLFGSNVLVSGLQGLGAEIGMSLLVINLELMYVQ
jgi:ubiquitin-activating enzyme E1